MKKTVCTHKQTFRSFNITPLLIGIIFGTTFEHLHEREILYRSNKVTVVYLNTMKRVNELFTIEVISTFRSDSLNSNCYFSAASKVSIKLEDEAPASWWVSIRNGGRGRGIVIVALEKNGWIVNMPMPTFINDHHWVFGNPFMFQHNWYTVTAYYWPIRITIITHGFIVVNVTTLLLIFRREFILAARGSAQVWGVAQVY